MSGFLEEAGRSGKGAAAGEQPGRMVYAALKRVTAMDKRVTIEMPDEMLRLVEEYAAGAGAAPDASLRDVIEQHLEDRQDLAVAEEAMAQPRHGEPTGARSIANP